MKKFKDNIDDFFKWVKGTELVELDDIDVSEDPVRPELTFGFRIMQGGKLFGLKTNTVLIFGITLIGLILKTFATSSAQAPEAFTIILVEISLFIILVKIELIN